MFPAVSPYNLDEEDQDAARASIAKRWLEDLGEMGVLRAGQGVASAGLRLTEMLLDAVKMFSRDASSAIGWIADI